MQRRVHDTVGPEREQSVDVRRRSDSAVRTAAQLAGIASHLVGRIGVDTDEFESRMQQWWTANAENREPSPARDPADFDLDLDAVRPRFADWVAASKDWTDHHQVI